MRGSWDLGGPCIAASTACGRKTALPSRTHVRNFRSVLEHASIRSLSRENASIFFVGPELERNRINEDQIFCTRDRAWEASFALFLSTAERRLTRAEADHLDKILCTRLRSRMGGIFCSLFIYRRASVYTSNFFERNHARHKTLYMKRPQVKTVPYCICMITFMHKPLEHKKTPS